MSDTNFLEKPVYPILFVVVISLIFVGVLAVMYRFNKDRIDAIQKERYEKTILGLCADSLASATGKSTADILASYPQSFQDYIQKVPQGTFSRPAFTVMHQDRLIAYVFDITGKGLWGTMRALIATNPGKDVLIGLYVYDQMETPGLGARIEEKWFTDQFKGKSFLVQGNLIDYTLIPEGQSPTDQTQIRRVTGATVTSTAVISMLQKEILAVIKPPQKVKS